MSKQKKTPAIYVAIDECIEYYNFNKHKSQHLTRLKLGRKLWPDKKESTIHSKLSNWQNGNFTRMCTVVDVVNMADILGVNIDVLIKRNHKKA